jgi:hypothetical protein
VSAEHERYWFRAKRYGWGWGCPCAWQGWLVLVVYLALVLGGIPFVQANRGSLLYLGYVLALTVVLLVICWRTGEPPRWRWGKRDA